MEKNKKALFWVEYSDIDDKIKSFWVLHQTSKLRTILIFFQESVENSE